MPCKMCQQRVKDWEGDDPQCAFVGSFFVSDNWNCATANAVRDISGPAWEPPENDLVFARRYDDQSAAYISVPHIELESGPADGLFVGWYKNRGRTESMWLLGEGQPRVPTENDCLAIIAAFSKSS